jgi:hypothetical protein
MRCFLTILLLFAFVDLTFADDLSQAAEGSKTEIFVGIEKVFVRNVPAKISFIDTPMTFVTLKGLRQFFDTIETYEQKGTLFVEGNNNFPKKGLQVMVEVPAGTPVNVSGKTFTLLSEQ